MAESVLTWTELYAELRAPLLRYLAKLGLPAAEAEDVGQDVFLALGDHLRAGKPRDNLAGWVFRVGHNLGLRQRTRLQRSLPEVSSICQAPNPEQIVAAKARRKRIRAVIDALPERDRCCLALRAQGLRYREIAERLDISLGSVAASIARSLDKLSRHAAS
ncbi:MAG: sigma-70 family RNA polymerase sigma factor [Acidobacteria bacterium]|nr:sigma-70 family RNA polymerase sigma factor [Acidobacteriota bacterium]